mmetsp:Transcript_3241/g.5014  ORF Transcript_3241/g.5014 Transcript_3241/m.5014 type:complete len:105 (-) Transcript_3241:1-315(-)
MRTGNSCNFSVTARNEFENREGAVTVSSATRRASECEGDHDTSASYGEKRCEALPQSTVVATLTKRSSLRKASLIFGAMQTLVGRVLEHQQNINVELWAHLSQS